MAGVTEGDQEPAVVRHSWPDRTFHWAMAVAVLILLLSSLLPIAGLKFDWIPWHWIAGVCLTVLLVFHIVRAVVVHGLSPMLPTTDDLREALGKPSDNVGALSKYDFYQKGYHWTIAIVILGLVGTGLLMLFKLDTPLWNRDPGILSDLQWGYVYVIHGMLSLVLIFFTIVHVYFALLPEHKPLLVSMIKGGDPQSAAQSQNAAAVQGESQ